MGIDRRKSRAAGEDERMDAQQTWPPEDVVAGGGTVAWNGDGAGEMVEAGIERLRADAVRIARADAASGVPATNGLPPVSEFDLTERCRAFAQRVGRSLRLQAAESAGRHEERVADGLARASLKVDRFERLTNDLTRLRARREIRRREFAEELVGEHPKRARGIPTKVYLIAISFLGLVEFFANAPIFSRLLPRDSLTERQIRLLSETSEGWFAGAERVFAHILLRPDAALLATGVILFLLVMAHFFGHALRSLVIQQDHRARKETVASRSVLENLVPIVVTGIGMALALGVLFEARVMLGTVGEERYTQDLAQVEELRREAGWLRADGNLLAANELTNRAEDMEAVALELREYSGSMARMSYQIFLLNLTLVLCAVAVAYFHARDSRAEKFNEDAFEADRKELVDAAESTAAEISTLLTELMPEIRRFRTALAAGDGSDLRLLVPQLKAVVALYRAENGRARGLDPDRIEAFRTPISLHIEAVDDTDSGDFDLASVESFEAARSSIQERFDSVRRRFAEEVRA